MRRKLVTAAFLCSIALCQAHAPPMPDAPIAKPSDLSISCHIDASARSAQITIMNRTAAPVRIRIGGPMIDNRAEIRSVSGRRLRSHDIKPSGGVWDASIAGTEIAPGTQYSETVALRDLVDIPSAGGTFEIRIGRGLLPLAGDPSQLDPKEIVWCKPVRVTFPPLK